MTIMTVMAINLCAVQYKKYRHNRHYRHFEYSTADFAYPFYRRYYGEYYDSAGAVSTVD